jgi:type VI secretion system protein ImpJ
MNTEFLPRAIQWHEGMLLVPQHFQQLVARQEELLHYHIAAVSPFHWGIRKLKVDESALLGGMFSVSELEAVMPDGLLVYYPDVHKLEADLKPYTEEMKQKAMTVYLAVPAKRSGGAYIKGILPRYHSAEGERVADENTGEAGEPIPRLIPCISLLVTDSPEQKYCAFPIAKVFYKDETYILTDFIPPLLNASLDSDIGKLCLSIAQQLRKKAVFLYDKINAEDSAMRDTGTESKFLFRSIVSALPQFEAVLNTGKSHPYALYVTMGSLLGNLASIGSGTVPPVMPRYNHDDLRATFKPLHEFILRLIQEGIRESHTPVPFDSSEKKKGRFTLKLREEWMRKKLVIGFRGRKKDGGDLGDWILLHCQIGSSKIIQSIKDKRIRGAGREKIEKDDELIPPKGMLLFSVAAEPEFIQADEVLEIFGEPAQSDLDEIILYVKNKA